MTCGSRKHVRTGQQSASLGFIEMISNAEMLHKTFMARDQKPWQSNRQFLFHTQLLFPLTLTAETSAVGWMVSRPGSSPVMAASIWLAWPFPLTVQPCRRLTVAQLRTSTPYPLLFSIWQSSKLSSVPVPRACNTFFWTPWFNSRMHRGNECTAAFDTLCLTECD